VMLEVRQGVAVDAAGGVAGSAVYFPTHSIDLVSDDNENEVLTDLLGPSNHLIDTAADLEYISV